MNIPLNTRTVSRFGRNTLWSILNQGISQVMVLIVFIITSRFITKESFGLMAVAMLIVEAFKQIFIESIATRFFATKDNVDEDYSAGFNIVIFGSVIGFLIIFFSASFIGKIFKQSSISEILIWISFLLLTAGTSKMHEVWLIKHGNFQILASRSFFSIFAGGVIGITMAMNGYGVTSLIAQQIVTAVVATAWLWLGTNWRPDFRIHFKRIKKILSFTKYIVINQAIWLAGSQADIFFTAFYLGAAQTGIYNASKRLSTASILIINSGLNSVAFPALAGLQGDQYKQNNAFLQLVFFTASVAAPIFFNMALFSYELVDMLLGEKWIDAWPTLSILSIINLILCLEQYSNNIIYIKNKPNWQTIVSISKSIVSVTIVTLSASQGLQILALSLLIKTFLFWQITTFLALKLLNISAIDYLNKIKIPIISAALMFICVYLIKYLVPLPPLKSFCSFIPISLIFYFSIFYVLNKREFMEVFKIFSIIIRRN